MLTILDFKVDDSDDIVLLGDIEFDYDYGSNVVKTSQRRITARQDDFALRNVGAGAEKYLNQFLNTNIKYLLQADIARVLTTDNLFRDGEFIVKTLDMITEHKLPILVKLITPFAKNASFKTIVNTHNQRNYK